MQPIGIASIGGGMPQPPYIRFEKRAVEKRKLVEEGGTVFYEDVDFALVTPFGSKDTVEKIVQEWFARLVVEVRDSRFPQQWLDAYKAAYVAWKNDQEPPIIGTDIRQWPAASPAEIKILTSLHCTSIEALAEANEEFLMRYGMGGRALQQKAQMWLAAKKDHGPIVERIAALEAAMTGLKSQVDMWKMRAEVAERALNSIQPQMLTTQQPVFTAPVRDNTESLISDGIEAGFSNVVEE